MDKDNVKMPDASFTIKDSSGETILSGSTDANGLTPVIFVDGLEQLKVEAKWGDLTGTTEFTPDKTGQYNLEIKEKGKKDDAGFLPGFEGILVISSIMILITILFYSEKRKSFTW